jgi:hypothetical protein
MVAMYEKKEWKKFNNRTTLVNRGFYRGKVVTLLTVRRAKCAHVIVVEVPGGGTSGFPRYVSFGLPTGPPHATLHLLRNIFLFDFLELFQSLDRGVYTLRIYMDFLRPLCLISGFIASAKD